MNSNSPTHAPTVRRSAGRTALRAALAAAAACASVAIASAHPFTGMATRLEVTTGAVEASIRILIPDTLVLVPSADRDGDGHLSDDEAALGAGAISARVASRLDARLDGRRLAPVRAAMSVSVKEDITGRPHELTVAAAYPFPDATTAGAMLAVDPNVFRTRDGEPPVKPASGGDKNTVTVIDGGAPVLLQCNGTETYSTAAWPAGRPAEGMASADGAGGAPGEAIRAKGSSPTALAAHFAGEGVHHIVFGWDHVAFILALVLGATKVMDLVKVITAFTVAHSITLGLTALGVIRFPRPELVDGMVALTIASLATYNLVRMYRGVNTADGNARWGVAFGFGLVHGLAFAGNLTDMVGGEMAGRTGLLAVCLLAFNIGVETGQLVILAVIFPALQAVRRYTPVAGRRIEWAGSAAVMFMGVSWALDRTLMPGKIPWAF